MYDNKIVTIGICTGGSIRAETTMSLVSGMIKMAQANLPPSLLIQIGGYVDINRNVIARSILKENTTHLMFIDADMDFPDDGILRLLKQDKPVIGANYNVRLDPKSNTVTGPTVKMLVDGQPVSIAPGGLPKKTFKCYALATGFMMINVEVFKKLKFPWFEATINKKGEHTTEDIDFCRKAHEAGIEVWCDPTIKVGHIGQTVF